MTVTVDQRFRTGEVCPESGPYRFDGFVKEPAEPLRVDARALIELDSGEPFPTIGNPDAQRECYWRPANEATE